MKQAMETLGLNTRRTRSSIARYGAAEGVEDQDDDDDDDDDDGEHDSSIQEGGESKQETNRFSISYLLYPILFWQASKKKAQRPV